MGIGIILRNNIFYISNLICTICILIHKKIDFIQ